MTRWLIIIGGFALVSCDSARPFLSAYQRPIDALASVLPLSLIGIHSCASLENDRGMEILVALPTDQCFKMLPQQRYQGIWVDEFEGSRFFENVSDTEIVKQKIRTAATDPVYEGSWLGWANDARPPVGPSRLVWIEFIGRKTAYPGHYGHLGLWNSEIVVDRVITMRTVYRFPSAYAVDERRSR